MEKFFIMVGEKVESRHFSHPFSYQEWLAEAVAEKAMFIQGSWMKWTQQEEDSTVVEFSGVRVWCRLRGLLPLPLVWRRFTGLVSSFEVLKKIDWDEKNHSDMEFVRVCVQDPEDIFFVLYQVEP